MAIGTIMVVMGLGGTYNFWSLFCVLDDTLESHTLP